MPEREGKNRVCGCKVLMHGLVVLYHTHTTHTQTRANSRFSVARTRAHCTIRGPTEDDGIAVWPITRRLADWQVLNMEATEVCEAQQAVSMLTGS